MNDLVPAIQMARLNITINGQQGDLPDLVSFDTTDVDLRRVATEAVRQGYVPGIDASENVNFTDFVVDRFPARGDVPFNRLSLRPKVPFGSSPEGGAHPIEQDVLHVVPLNQEVTAREVFEMLGCSRTHAHRTLNILTEKGLVNARVSRVDGITRYTITPMGEREYLNRVMN